MSSASCVACSEGTVPAKGSSACTGCSASAYATDSADDSDGYGVTTRASHCVECPEGRYGNAPQTTECLPCGLGESSLSNSTACFQCTAGKITGTLASASCSDCLAGTFSASDAQSSCSDCSGNTYSLAASSSCALCLASFYISVDGDCVSGPPGSSCATDGGSSQSSLELNEGYWRVSESSTDVRSCPLPRACAGSNNTDSAAADDGSARRLDETDFSDEYCALCAVCDVDGGFFFDPERLSCSSCVEEAGGLGRIANSPSLIIFLAVATAAILGSIALCAMNRGRLARTATEKKSAMQHVKIEVLKKIYSKIRGPGDACRLNSDGSVTFTAHRTKNVQGRSKIDTGAIPHTLQPLSPTA